MRNPTWKQLFLLLAIATALVALLIWDQTDRPDTTEIVVEPAVFVTETTSTTTIDLSWLNTTTTTVKHTASTTKPADVDAFFDCVKWRESRNNYQAVDSSGTFRGAYQIYQGGWDAFAARINRHDLIGVAPDAASPADQDAIALAMFNELGSKPWNGACS